MANSFFRYPFKEKNSNTYIEIRGILEHHPVTNLMTEESIATFLERESYQNEQVQLRWCRYQD